MAEQNQIMGVVDKAFGTVNTVVDNGAKLIGKSFDTAGAVMDSVSKNATSVLDTFTKKVNEALGNAWTGFGSK